MNTLTSTATEMLKKWHPQDKTNYEDQKRIQANALKLLETNENAMYRECEAGHLVGSIIIYSPDATHVLLTLHKKIGKWLQLGGHCEPQDQTLLEVAKREAREESGLSHLTFLPDPIRLDEHDVPHCLPSGGKHFDIQYIAIAPENAEEQISDESLALEWWPVDNLPENSDLALVQLVAVSTPIVKTLYDNAKIMDKAETVKWDVFGLAKMGALRAGWLDGEGEEIKIEAIETARALYQELSKTNLETPAVFPTIEGGIRFEWLNTNSHLSVDILPTGQIENYYLNIETKEEQISISTENPEETISFVTQNWKPAKP